MIWNSVPLMTAIDLVIIAVTLYGIWRCRPFIRGRRSSASRIGVWLVASGLLVVCLFYAADLISMHALPAITSEQEAMALMDALHRQLGWLVVLFAVIAISTGFVSLLSELQDREARARRLVESNIIGVFIWGRDGRIIDANDAYLRIMGYDRGDLIAGRLNWRDLTPPEWRTADDRRVAQLEASGTAQPYEKEYFRKDGSRVPVLVGAATFEGTSDEGAAFVFDLTDRKKADEAVRASEIRWRTIFEKFPVGIVLRDAEHRYMSANPAFQQMVGYSERELIHLSPLDITHEDDRPASERMLTELQSGVRQTVEKEKRFRRKDGSVVWTMVSTFHIPEAGPIPAFNPAIVVDITKRKQAEEALRESELELARVSRLTTMGELAASIAHELRQPLSAAVTNGTTWLSEDTLDLARARKAAQRMIAAAQRASEVMDRIRGLINKTPSEKISVVVNDLICETL